MAVHSTEQHGTAPRLRTPHVSSGLACCTLASVPLCKSRQGKASQGKAPGLTKVGIVLLWTASRCLPARGRHAGGQAALQL